MVVKDLKSTVKKLKHIPEGGNFKCLPDELKIKAKMSNIYRRLDRNKPSNTIIANGGGGTWGYHYSENRKIINRERARLQGFPDNFVFKGSNSEIRKQIGNAVPPLWIYPIGVEIYKILKEEHESKSYRS